jgi:hypothetical protein
MCCPRPPESSSSDNSDTSDIKSCFDTGDEGETYSGTNATDVDTDIKGEDDLDVSWIIEEDKEIKPFSFHLPWRTATMVEIALTPIEGQYYTSLGP